MALKSYKITMPKSIPGEYSVLEVSIPGATADSTAFVTPRERKSLTDRRGQMDFITEAGVDKVTVRSEEKELYEDTELNLFVDVEATGSEEFVSKTEPNQNEDVPEKVTPAVTDTLIIEDSEAQGVKKKVQVGNLPGGGGGGEGDLVDASIPLNIVNNAIGQYWALLGAGIELINPAEEEVFMDFSNMHIISWNYARSNDVKDKIASTSGFNKSSWQNLASGRYLEVGKVFTAPPVVDANTVGLWLFEDDLTDEGTNALDLVDAQGAIGTEINYTASGNGTHGQALRFDADNFDNPGKHKRLTIPTSNPNHSLIDQLPANCTIEFMARRHDAVSDFNGGGTRAIISNVTNPSVGGDNPDNIQLLGKWTVEAWVNTNQNNNNVIWSKGERGATPWIEMNCPGIGGIQAWGNFSDGEGFAFETPQGDVVNQGWVHVALTFDNETTPGETNMVIYINGVQQASQNWMETKNFNGFAHHSVGAGYDGNGNVSSVWNGMIDDFVLSNGVAKTTFDLVNEATTITHPDATIIYNFNGDLQDASGNGYNGTERDGSASYGMPKYGTASLETDDMMSWMYVSFGGFFVQGGGGGGVGRVVEFTEDGQLNVFFGSRQEACGSGQPVLATDDQWHHYAVLIDDDGSSPFSGETAGPGVHFYLDGSRVSSCPFSGNYDVANELQSDQDILIGATRFEQSGEETNWFTMDLDALKVHNTHVTSFGTDPTQASLETKDLGAPVGLGINKAIVQVIDTTANVIRTVDGSTDGTNWDVLDLQVGAELNTPLRKVRATYDDDGGMSVRVKALGVFNYKK